VLPGRIPDLFAGQPLTVFGRYEGKPSGEILVRGRLGARTIELPVTFDIADADDVAGVWSVLGRHKGGELLGYPLLGASQEVGSDTQKAVVELALQYRIMTAYPSFVAVDERRIVEPNGEIRTVVQPLPIPAGTTYEGFMGEGLIGKGGGG